MLKIIIIFMLLTLIGSPMNTSSLDNTSINKSINNSSLNGTDESYLKIDMNLFNWFSKPAKATVGLNLRLALEDIKHDYLKNAIESYSAEKSMTEEDFSKRSIPPAINEGLERYPGGDVDDEDPEIPFDPDEEWDSWLNKPPWEEDIERGCSELVCDEYGICLMTCVD